ncbi:hypothetical protein SAMN05216559_2342 [Halomicrobium zhouii]|uniref:PAS domain S-box-containing protein n=1 Tax=Halomicrobium zhouii TaxID=767519 RepID=A0A1I6LAP3_9EURY|nr:bacterio-opsin activator domain-containing protein [Halomicrobium zhouii]SFS00308.1 hypothetical protein SAMN05216559_2342 [Halomicrobium zhouii]
MVSELEADYRVVQGEAATRLLYVDADEETMATVARYVEGEYSDVELVGTTDAGAAVDTLRSAGWGCLVVGGDLPAADRSALVEAASCPIVSFTRAGRDADTDPVVAAATMVLEKGTDERILAMLVDKARQFAGAGPDGDDESLARTLTRLGDADEDIACFVVDDGDLAWASRPFETTFPVAAADVPDGDFDDRLAAVFGDVPDPGTSLVTVETDDAGSASAGSDDEGPVLRYYRYASHRIPDERRLDVFEDVTDRVERETRSGLYELLVEQARDGLYVFDADGVVVFTNEAFASMLGYDPEDLIGKHAAEIFAEGELHAAQRDIKNVVDSEDTGGAGDRTFLDCHGDPVPVSVNYTVLAGDETDFDGFVCVARDVTERRKRERELAERRDELARINRADALVQNVVRELGQVSSRDELEQAVCECFLEVDGVTLAWVGNREGASDRIVPGTVVGEPRQYLHDLLASASVDGATGGPAMRAVRTGDVKLAADLRDGDREDVWRSLALSHDLYSLATIPLIHGETVHGVLAVYGDRPEAFGDALTDRFHLLGDTIGFAMTAVQNRRLLEEDVTVELEFRADSDEARLVWLAQACDCRLEIVGSVDLGEDVLQYLAVDGASVEAVADAAVESDAVTGARVIRAEGSDAGVVELRTPWSLRSALSEVGARLEAAVITPASTRIVVEAPSDADVRAIHEAVRRSNPGATLVTKTEGDRSRLDGREGIGVTESLTDRQQEVLQAAYLAGYYAWPRDTTAEELAESLGIASPTLHQHLRRAERNILDALFGE